MQQTSTIQFENEAFEGWIDESIAVVKIKSNAFYSLVNMDISKRVLDWFDQVAEFDEIDCILIINEKGCLGTSAYEVFVTELTGKKIINNEKTPLSNRDLIQIRLKEINILNSFISATVAYKKLVITGLNGTIFTPFLGASLASNFRFASDDMNISFSHVKYGIHAGGALPFFLPKFIGYGKASDYIFNGGELSAENALGLGLINKIFPSENFENLCITEAKRLSLPGSRYLRWTKHLSTPFKQELKNYLREEEETIDHYKQIE